MLRVLWVLVLVAACGDNTLPDGLPLGASRDVTIIAHPDDDLLFMQPDLLRAVQGGEGVTTIYVTAGNGSDGVPYSETRYAGAQAAYAEAADNADWQCGWIALAGHAAEHCRLAAANVSLVFLGYPDGGIEGDEPNSLLHLWEGTIDGADTVARRPAHYDQAGLVAALAEAIGDAQPHTIRSLDVSATHGRDHSDHWIVGALALLAAAESGTQAGLMSYRGYDVTAEPSNALPGIFDRSALVLAHYEACVDGCAACGEACTKLDPSHMQWLNRRYAVGYRHDTSGTLRQGTQCLAADPDGAVALTDCAVAPAWHFTRTNLMLGTQCLTTLPTGDLVVGACANDPAHTFRFDDEGRIWAGTLPDHSDDMTRAHLRCLVPDAGRVRADLCGIVANVIAAPVWELGHPVEATVRTAIGMQQSGRAVQLVDLTGDRAADLCEIRPNGLWCARGVGDGTFATAIRIDDPAAPLAIDPASLTIGDVDGDGLVSACGLDALGVLCAKAPAFSAQRWSSAFADGTPATAASLTAIDADGDGRADLCGVTASGVICVHGDIAVDVRSRWPDATAPLILAELDGDDRADWCSVTTAGFACGLAADRDVTTAGAPWSFSLGGTIATGDLSTAVFADLDGDGRADACTSESDHIACAHSEGHDFGPRFTVFDRAGAIYLGDLDGDGRTDICVDDGNEIACSLLR